MTENWEVFTVISVIVTLFVTLFTWAWWTKTYDIESDMSLTFGLGVVINFFLSFFYYALFFDWLENKVLIKIRRNN